MNKFMARDDAVDASARERLVAAGLELFGEHGFDATTTRMLARRAGVNLGAIPYYFGTKEQLYLAVAEQIADRLRQRAGPALEAAQAVAANDDASPEALMDALTGLLTGLARVIHAEGTSDHVARFVLHEQLSPTPAFDVLYDGLMSKVHATACGLFARLTGASPRSEDTRLRVSALIGQVVVFRAARALVLRTLRRDGYTDALRARIRRIIAEHTQAVVLGLAGRSS